MNDGRATATAGAPPVLEIEPLAAPPDAVVRLPGSKSITNRAVLCAALAEGETRIKGALFADDTEAMFAALRALGADLDLDSVAETVTVRGAGGLPGGGGAAEPGGATAPGSVLAIDARMSGTTSRFLAPVAATGRRSVMIDGHPQLRGRPFGDLVEGLRALGVEVEAPAGSDCLPLRVTGPMRHGEAAVAADRSSQFLSGLMLAAPLTGAGLSIRLASEAVSRPYVEMTAAVMEAFGAVVKMAPDRVRVEGGGYRSPGVYEVEPDATAASYFWAAAAVTGGTVRVAGLGPSSLQGDVGFARVLEQMGCTMDSDDRGLAVTGAPLGEDLEAAHSSIESARRSPGASLRGIEVDLAEMSDTAPTLAVVAAVADGPTAVRGIGFIRAKESDRIAAVVSELCRCGVDASEHPDGFTVSPRRVPAGAVIRTYDDHRLAMAFSVLGLAVGGMKIENPDCAAKTFPDFYRALDSLRSGSRNRQAGGWHGGQVLPPRGKTAPVTGPAGRSKQPPGRSR